MRGGARLRWVGALAVCAVLGGGLVGACHTPPVVAPEPEPGQGTCPDVYTGGPMARTRLGALVPDGATDALLCVYPFGPTGPPGSDPGSRTLRAPAGSMAALTAYLNSLQPHDPDDVLSCPAMGHDQYQIVFAYPGETHALVWVDYNCGIVWSAGASAKVDGMDRLLGFWPDA